MDFVPNKNEVPNTFPRSINVKECQVFTRDNKKLNKIKLVSLLCYHLRILYYTIFVFHLFIDFPE